MQLWKQCYIICFHSKKQYKDREEDNNLAMGKPTFREKVGYGPPSCPAPLETWYKANTTECNPSTLFASLTRTEMGEERRKKNLEEEDEVRNRCSMWISFVEYACLCFLTKSIYFSSLQKEQRRLHNYSLDTDME